MPTEEELLANIPDMLTEEELLADIPDVRELSAEEAYSRLMYPMPTAEQEALHEDYIPLMIPGIGVTIGMQTVARGGSLLYGAARGTIASGLAAGAETYIRPLEEYAGEIHPYLKPIVGLTAGIGSAITIEALGTELLAKALTKSAPKFWTKQLTALQREGIIEKEFIEDVKHILSRMDEGDTEAIQIMLNKLKAQTHDEVLSKASKKMKKIQEIKTPEVPSTEKVIKKLSKKKLLDDTDYQRLAEIAERDAIHEYQSEFTRLKTQIINKQWELEKVANPKIKKAAIEYQYREEFDRIYRDEILLRIQEKESEYLAKILGLGKGAVTTEELLEEVMTDIPGKGISIRAFELGRKIHSGEVDLSVVKSAQKTFAVKTGIDKMEQATRGQFFSEAIEFAEILGGKIAGKAGKIKILQKLGELPKDFTGEIITKPSVSIKAVTKALSNTKSVGDVVREVTALRNTTRRLANIIKRQTTKEVTAASKAKMQRLQYTYRSKMAEYRAALKIKNEVGLISKRLSRYLTKGKEMPNEYREQISSFLSPMFDKPSVKLNETMWKFLQRKYNDEFSIGADILLKKYDDMLKSLPSRTHSFKGLTHAQAKDLDDFTKAFQFVGKNERIITYRAEKRLLEEVSKEIYTSALKGKPKLKVLHPRITGTQLEELSKGTKGAVGQFMKSSADVADGFFAALKRMEPIVRQLDGFQEAGTAWKQIFNKAVMAEVSKEHLGQKVFSKYREIFQAHRIANRMGRQPAKYWTAISGNLAGYKLNKETAIVIALNTGNKGNMEAMLRGLQVTEGEVMKFLDTTLNKSDWKLVNNIWDTLDNLFPIMSKVYKDMTGLTLQRVKGRYYPIIADRQYMDFREGFEDLFLEANRERFMAAVEKGFTKTRVGGVKSIKATLRPLTQHLEDVVHMATHWKPVNEIQRLTKHDLFKQAVNETMGKDIYKQFDPWLKNLARPNMTAYPDILVEKTLGKARRNVTTVALGCVPKVGVKQTLSFITAIPEIGAKNAMASCAKFMTNPRRFLININEASPEMMFRQKTWQRELAEMATKYSHKGNLKGGTANWYFKFIHLFDRVTSSVVWHGAYIKGLDDMAGDANRAVNFANMIVRKTQPASAPKDLPYIMRAGEINRSITLFYSYYSVYHNQAMEIVQRGLAGNMSVPKVLSTLFFLAAAPTIAWHGAGAAWNVLTGRDEGEFDTWEFSKAVGVNTLAGIPLARDLASATVMGYDYRLSPIEDIGVELADTGKALAKLTDEDKEFTKYDMISSFELAGYIFNLPSRQAITTVLAAQRLLDDETDDWSELLVRPKYQKGE